MSCSQLCMSFVIIEFAPLGRSIGTKDRHDLSKALKMIFYIPSHSIT